MMSVIRDSRSHERKSPVVNLKGIDFSSGKCHVDVINRCEKRTGRQRRWNTQADKQTKIVGSSDGNKETNGLYLHRVSYFHFRKFDEVNKRFHHDYSVKPLCGKNTRISHVIICYTHVNKF